MTVFAAPGSDGSAISVESRYDNFIGGEWVPPSKGDYFENFSPVNGKVFTEIARSTGEDIELALDAAHGAKHAWAAGLTRSDGKTKSDASKSNWHTRSAATPWMTNLPWSSEVEPMNGSNRLCK